MGNRRRCFPLASPNGLLALTTTIAVISSVTSFQIGNRNQHNYHQPTLLTTKPLSASPTSIRSWVVSSSSVVSKTILYDSTGGDNSNEGGSDDSVPFFAQATKEDKGVAVAVEEAATTVAVAEKTQPEEETKVPESKAEAEARILRAQAEKARLEAEKMDVVLTLEKIAKLEKRLANVESLKKHPEQEQEIREQIDLLSRKLNGEEVAITAPPKTPSKTTKKDDTIKNSSGNDEKDGETMDLEPISEEELQRRTEAFLAAPKVLREMTAKSAGFDDDSDVEGIVTKTYYDEQRRLQRQKETNALPKEGELPIVLDEKEIQDAIDGFEKLPEGIRDMVGKSVGLDNGKNATAVIYKLNEEKRLMPSKGDGGDGLEGGFEVKTELIDFFEDAEFIEKANYVRSLLPEVCRKDYQAPTDDDIDVFFRKVCGKKTFNPYTKPEMVPGGVIIRGENCVGEDSIDDMVSAMEEKVKENNLDKNLRLFYMLDPTPVTEEQINNEEYETPVILLTGADVAPETSFTTKGIISALGVVGIASFSLGALSFNDGFMDRLTNAADLGDGNLSWISDLAAPLFLATLGIQLAHELAHRIVAFKDKFDIGLPTIVPSLQLGLTGAITPINTPPKNLKSLFDFAISGPLVGIFVSLALMYVGLEKTAFMDAAELSQLPGLPVQLLRSSSLGGGIIEYLLGDGILLSPDPTATVSLHPYAIAGFVGIMSNALALLPAGNTDGGRVAHAVLGRSLSRVLQGFTLLLLVIVGIFGADESNILLFYSLFVTIWQREPEMPCKNEVDELDLARGAVAIGAAVLVALALVPLS